MWPAWRESSMRFFSGSISSGKTAPSLFLHKQLDVTIRRFVRLLENLCQFELQARYLATRIPFPGLAGLMTHIQRDLRSLALHLHSRSRQIGLRESHGCAGMRRKNGNLDIDSDDEVIALKFIEELIVVVE